MSNARRRLVVGVSDQAASSLTNVLTVVAVAHSSSQGAYGAFAVMFGALAFTLSLGRASFGTLLSVRGDPDVGFQDPEIVTLWQSTALLVLVGAALTAAVALISGALGALPGAFVWALVLSPIVLVQDSLRFAAVTFRKPGAALLSDVVWLFFVLVPVALSWISSSMRLQPLDYFVLWLVGGGAATAVLVRTLRPGLVPRPIPSWVRSNWRYLTPLLADGALASSVPLLVSILTAKFLGLGDIAGLRGASLLIGPIAILFSAIQLVVVPEVSRGELSQQRRTLNAMVLGLALVVAVWGGVLSLLPIAVGQRLLGPTWGLAHEIIPISTVEYLVWALAAAPVAILKVQGRFGSVLAARVVYVLSALIGTGVCLVLHGGVFAVAWALVGAVLFHAVAAWAIQWRHSTHQPEAAVKARS